MMNVHNINSVIYLETNTCIAGAIHPRHPQRLQTPRRKSPHISMDWQAKHLAISRKGPAQKMARLIAVGVYLADIEAPQWAASGFLF